MIEIEKPRIDIAELTPDGTYGRFVVEPLEKGYGTTLGNSLRRVLLSSLEGVAVQYIKIDGVVHEFSTIPGVKEDVAEIILNIKGLTAKLYGDGPKSVVIDAEAKAKSLQVPSCVTARLRSSTPTCTLPHWQRVPISTWRSPWAWAADMFPLTATRPLSSTA